MPFQAVLFDLDGTLLDTLDDLTSSMNRALSAAGFPVHPREAYKIFVGDGMETLVTRALPDPARNKETVEKLFLAMRSDYSAHWADQTRAYDGVSEMLGALEKRGLKLAVLSNKPDDFTQDVISRFFPDVPFIEVRGQKKGGPKKPDPFGALEIARSLNLKPLDFLYLGDTSTDMRTAVAAGMFPVGALWGFRSKAELLESGAKTVIEHPMELLKLL